MKKEKSKKLPSGILITLVVILLIAVAVLTVILLLPDPEQKNPTPDLPQNTTTADVGNDENLEDPGVPLVTEYIVLSYPSELEDQVNIQYEELADGQQVIFTTDFTGEELELFRFSISKSGTDGYELGVLAHEEAGELIVCTNVKEYISGNWTPEDYAKLIAMQERVNDIIIQFYEDPRFTAAKS